MIKLSGLSEKETLEIIPHHTILLGYVGSLAHGTYIPKNNPDSIDDKDILGICIAPSSVYFGLKKFEQKEVKKGEWDSVVYEIRKFFRLLLQQNPNVLGLLWLQEKDYIYISEAGQLILDNRKLFVSKAAYHSFVGYAHGQFHRMTYGAFDGYMGAKRKALVEQFGYDCKNASHLIRLLRMGIEYLTDGKLQIFRNDAPELKEIKSGKWTLEKVKLEADRLFKLSQEAFIKSTLPAEPNKMDAEVLLISILKKELGMAEFIYK
jgi:predicted nucleotidyltransferase